MTTISDIENREDALRSAMLAGDVAALSSLIDDGLVFTGPDGNVLGKEQDVAAHASGILKLSRIDLFDGQVHSLGDTVLVTTKARLAGTFAGATIHGTYAYSRFWAQRSGDWRVVAGHAARIG
jgi:ketosteroid isomerase-like protein